MSSTPALGSPRVPSLIPLVNPLVRRLLGAGLPFGPNVLLTVRGRSSGLPRTFPVAILDLDGRRYVQSPFGEVDWVRNLRAAQEAVVSKGRSREDVEAVEVAPDEAGRILRAALSTYMRTRVGAALVRRLFHIATDATLEQFVAEAGRHPMFELRTRALGSQGQASRDA